MPKTSCIVLAAPAVLCLIAPAYAISPVCQTVFAYQANLKTKPFHMYMTEERKFSSPNMAKAAGSIGIGKTHQSEEISTGKSIYVLHGGKWIDMQTSFAAMSADKDNDPDAKKARDAEQCTALPDESVSGQAASVFKTHNPETGIDTKIWISKSTHLPLKSEITNDGGGAMTVTTISRYEYTNVSAPSGAISMQDMMRMRAKR